MIRLDLPIHQNFVKGFSLSLIVVLSGCGETRVVATPPIQIPHSDIFHPPLPSTPSLRSQEPWVVLPPGSTYDHTLYGMTPEQYQIASENNAKTLKYIKDLLDLLRYYRGLK
jgi:hypothetical protein